MSSKYKIIDSKILHKGFFDLKQLNLIHKKHDGNWSSEIKREVFGGAHVSTVLPYDPIKKKIILLQQFRPGIIKRKHNPIILEIVAGMIDEGEAPSDAAKRECLEETGCLVNKLIEIYSYYPAPGSSESFYHFFLAEVKSFEGEKIFGQKNEKLKDALNRKYTLPFLFQGSKNEKNELLKVLNSISLTLQEGGRVLNLCDNINKVKSMNKVVNIIKKTENKIKTIAVGDNYNDLDMLKNCDIPCLVFNDQFKLDKINIDNLIFSNKPSPEGWADVIKKALVKLEYND